MNGNIRPYINFQEGKILINRVVAHKNVTMPSLKVVTEVHEKGIVVGGVFKTYAEALDQYYILEDGFEIAIGRIIMSEDKKFDPAPMKMITMQYEEWVEQYKPILNPIVNDAPYDGTMFETYGDEVDYVRRIDIGNSTNAVVWTLISEGDRDFISPGFHIVNRLGYFITEGRLPENQEIQVLLYNPEIEDLADRFFDNLDNSDIDADIIDKIKDIFNDSKH